MKTHMWYFFFRFKCWHIGETGALRYTVQSVTFQFSETWFKLLCHSRGIQNDLWGSRLYLFRSGKFRLTIKYVKGSTLFFRRKSKFSIILKITISYIFKTRMKIYVIIKIKTFTRHFINRYNVNGSILIHFFLWGWVNMLHNLAFVAYSK